jgi:hypothetical protein
MKRFVYVPSTPPSELEQLVGWLRREFRAVSMAQQSIWDLDVLSAEPEHLFDGMVRFADGTNWNPGAGRGVYCYSAGAWVKL